METAHDARLNGPKQPSALERLEALAASGVSGGDGSAVVSALTELAAELAGPARDAKRLELLSNALACARVQSAVLEAMYATLIARRDEGGIVLVGRALRDTTARLTKLAEAHGAASERERRPALVVGRATVDFMKVG